MITIESLFDFLYNAFFIGFGICVQLVGILMSMSVKKGYRVWPVEFMRERPWKLTYMIMGGILGYFMATNSIEDPPAIMLIAVGWACNDAIDKMGSAKAHMKLKKEDI